MGETPGVLYGARALSGGGLVPLNANAVHWLILPGVGDVGRNTGEGPGFVDVGMCFAKKFMLRKSQNKSEASRDVELRLDAFNLLNHVNCKNYVGTVWSPSFGLANNAFAARELQVSVRFSF